ncbi:hypothetical protein [Kribbella sp. CA-293567]|uniref:hypothetical protein n=1 Tax=Kribbella sp. CA-293567 TaxID=3002436 RepID=UPI0022DE0438|nr:hypothetical protein [Kribbella sp. CA-293567]WBQ03796.1 hypothetical protein OX958_27980 [Kribbella sp. CA-293567]
MNSVLKFLAPYRKAILSGVLMAAPVAWQVMGDGHLSHAEAGLVIGAFLTGAGVVYKVPNAKLPDAKHMAGS